MRSILFILVLLSLNGMAETFKTPLKELPFHEQTIREDFSRILKEASLPEKIFQINSKDGKKSLIHLGCRNDSFELSITSSEEERTSSFYKALREMGFLFPHPLRQVSPDLGTIKKKCNKSWSWKPTLKFRGFHLHTLHPNEWISGFFQGKSEIAEKTIRWLARNQQNAFDLSLLRVPLSEIQRMMKPTFVLARKFQIHTGVSLGIAFHQQNSYKLLSLIESLFDLNTEKKLEKGLTALMDALPLSYIVLEAGTSEFTPADFEKSLNWLNLTGDIIRKRGVVHFTKVHVSTNQISSKWGNYNFLPQYAENYVGVLPHTVMFYGVVDEKAPMYGNKNFHGIRDFMLQEKTKRPTWYYPETSYWIGMDVDIPLFLTDYLTGRAEDMRFLHENGIEGQLNFTTGHALGYWLYDWNLALLADSDYNFDPLIGLKLLGENVEGWKKLSSYQNKWYKKKGLIALLSSANLQDELSDSHRIHDRYTMKQLTQNRTELESEIKLLKESLKEKPEWDFVKDEEIKTLLEVTYFRTLHALAVREAIYDKENKDQHLENAKTIRLKAKGLIKELSKLPTNYPDLPLFQKWKNPTSYKFGYAYPASILYFWRREENQIRDDSFFPFRNNMYNVLDIIF